MAYDYDVVVLGGGSAGSAAAATAANLGARTAMINAGELGGLCILRGCMPTKTLLASSHALHEATHTAPLGVHVDPAGVTFDFPFIMRRKTELVRRFQQAKIAGIEAGGYEVVDGRGAFVDPHTIDADGKHVTANRIVLATGSEPVIRDIPGIDGVRVLTSDSLMELTDLPESMLVHGAGPVGLEFAEFFARLGVRTVLVNRSVPFSKIDPDVSAEFAAVCDAQENLTVIAPGHVQRFGPAEVGFAATIETPDGTRTESCAVYLSALGRRAATAGLNLEGIGVEMDGNMVWHDAHMQTSVQTLYVAGDVTDAYQVLHLANQEGRVAGHNAAAGRNEHTMDYRLKMVVVFTDPPVATVGWTAAEAMQNGHEVVTPIKRFAEQGRGITMGVEHGLMKLVVDRATGEILGCQIIGPRADDLMHVVTAVMAHHGTAQDLYDLPWYHPTLAEAFIEVARMALADLNDAAHLPGQF